MLHAIDSLTSSNPLNEQRYQRACAVDDATEWAQVVTRGHDVCGFVFISRVLDEATVMNIAVLPQARGRGLGKQLLSTALNELRQQGVSRCLLEVRESNRAALALYQSLGFGVDGVRKGYYPVASGREDALMMSKTL